MKPHPVRAGQALPSGFAKPGVVSNRILVSRVCIVLGLTFGWVPPQIGEKIMKSFAKKVQRFLVSEDGPTAVEYAVMLALIIIVCLTAISAVGTQAATQFNNIATQVGTSGS